MNIGTIVVHCMGHRGVVVAVDGPFVVIVRFVNTTNRCFVSDLVALCS